MKSPKAEGGIRKRKCELGGGAGVRIVRYFDENAGMRDPDRLLHIGRSRTGLKSVLHPRYYKSVFFFQSCGQQSPCACAGHADVRGTCGVRAPDPLGACESSGAGCEPLVYPVFGESSEVFYLRPEFAMRDRVARRGWHAWPRVDKFPYECPRPNMNELRKQIRL